MSHHFICNVSLSNCLHYYSSYSFTNKIFLTIAHSFLVFSLYVHICHLLSSSVRPMLPGYMIGSKCYYNIKIFITFCFCKVIVKMLTDYSVVYLSTLHCSIVTNILQSGCHKDWHSSMIPCKHQYGDIWRHKRLQKLQFAIKNILPGKQHLSQSSSICGGRRWADILSCEPASTQYLNIFLILNFLWYFNDEHTTFLHQHAKYSKTHILGKCSQLKWQTT